MKKLNTPGPIIENDCLGLYQPLSGNPNIPFHEQIFVVDIDGDGIKEILASHILIRVIKIRVF